MKISKAQWTTDGDGFRLNMPLSKVNKETRIVSGFASLDNPDLQGDVVLAEASEKAFKRFRGNIREMHQPIAVGRMVSFRPETYYDKDSNKMYKGIWVDAYISRGAPDTWEKVCDGTLQAFSIKGPIKDYDHQFSKDIGKNLRIVKDYELEELSLVDSGGNQLANIMSIAKSVDGSVTAEGINTKLNSESVWFCAEDGVAKTSNDDVVECPNGHRMANIGLVEYADESELTEKVAEVVKAYDSSQHETAEQDSPATTEGGVDVADEEKETVAPGETVPAEVAPVEEGKAETEVAASVEEVGEHTHEDGDEHADEEVEKAADVSEVEVEEPDFAKMAATLEGLKGLFETGLAKTRDEIVGEVSKATEPLATKVEELEKANASLSQKFDSLTEQLTEVKKSAEAAVTKVDRATAVKKSGDLGGSTEDTVEKSNGGSKWGGVFVPVGGRRFLSAESLEEN